MSDILREIGILSFRHICQTSQQIKRGEIMKEFYYEKLARTLTNVYIATAKSKNKIANIRIGNKKIGELSKWELDDLRILWIEESRKKWKIKKESSKKT